jgi:hypothetical protein
MSSGYVKVELTHSVLCPQQGFGKSVKYPLSISIGDLKRKVTIVKLMKLNLIKLGRNDIWYER